MPTISCQKDGKSGFKFGETGKCFTYTTESGKERARNKADRQGAAINARRSAEVKKYEEGYVDVDISERYVQS